MARNIPTPLCVVCGAQTVAKQLCEKHYRRWIRHGDVQGGLRPADWGTREKHPLYTVWAWTNRGKAGRESEWNDFWQFVRDVGEKPSDSHRLRRIDNKEPWGPRNCAWRETLTGKTYTTATAEGKRRYQRDWRAAHPLRSKHHDLRKSYGIGLAEYDALLERQDGKCAICNTLPDRGLCVDHCHNSKAVRGLLCHSCNRALGMFDDNPLRLEAAAAYVRNGHT